MLAPKAGSCQFVATLAAGQTACSKLGECLVFLAAWRNEKGLTDCHRGSDLHSLECLGLFKCSTSPIAKVDQRVENPQQTLSLIGL